MTRTLSFVALIVGIALLVAAPGLGKGQPLRTDPATEAQILRGEALDRHYGIGKFAVDPATEAQILRGEALDRHYGIGKFATREGTRVDSSSTASLVPVTSSGSEIDWAQVGLMASIGLLLAAGLVAALRFRGIRPIGH